MKRQIRLILVTIVLTAVIWVYADLAGHETQRIPLAVELTVAPNSDLRVRVEGVPSTGDAPAIAEVIAKLSGSKAAFRELELDKQRSGGHNLRISVPVKETVGSNALRPEEIREYVSEWGRQHSLQLVDPIRQIISYDLDRWVQVDWVIEVDAGVFDGELKAPPQVEPDKVKAKLLASHLVKPEWAKRRLVIPIVDELRKQPDEELSFEVPLAKYVNVGDEVTFTPDRVRITVQRREGSRRQRLTAIPLHEMWPANRPAGQYRIAWPDDLDLVQHIDVMVPAGKPRALTNTDVLAFVTIEGEDLPAESAKSTDTAPAVDRGGILREVRFVFPPGFEDVRVLPPVPKVRFNVVRVGSTQPAH